MANLISSLGNNITPGRYNLASKETPSIILSEVEGFTLIQIAAWPETVAKVGRAVAKSAGLTKATGPGSIKVGKISGLLRAEPLKWWLIGEGEQVKIAPDLAAKDGCVLDISHSRAWVKIHGEKSPDLLNRFLPIDLRGGSFPSGSVATTAFHHAGVTLWRENDEFNLLLPRSFAVSLWEMLEESAKQFGLEVR